MAKQAKALEAKLRIAAGEEEEGGEEGEEGGDARERLWGASKRAYYGADLADLEVRPCCAVSAVSCCILPLPSVCGLDSPVDALGRRQGKGL